MKNVNLILLIFVCVGLAACPAKKVENKKEVAQNLEVLTDGKIVHLTDVDFEKFVKDKTVVVDFYADWCPPCREFSPVFEKIAKANTNLYFVKVNVDKAPVTSNTFGVQYIPYVILMKNGEFVEQFASNDRSETSFQNWVNGIN